MYDAKEPNVEWDICVPIFKNKIILKQLCFAIGIPFGIMILVLLLVKAYYGILLIGMLFLFTFVLVLIVFRGTYDIHFVVSEKNILCENQPNQLGRVKKLSLITFFAGLMSKNVTAAGIGMMSSQRTRVIIPWKHIRKINYNDKQKTIMIYGGFGENIGVFCENENYERIKEIIALKSKLANN